MQLINNPQTFVFNTKYNKEPHLIDVNGGVLQIHVNTEKMGIRVFTLSPGTWSLWEGYDKKFKKNRVKVTRVS